MRKTLLPALFLLVLTAPLIGQEPSTSPKSNVGVLIDSRPDYAEIQIDGKFIGTTPPCLGRVLWTLEQGARFSNIKASTTSWIYSQRRLELLAR